MVLHCQTDLLSAWSHLFSYRHTTHCLASPTQSLSLSFSLSLFFLSISHKFTNTHRAITHPSHLVFINALENYPVEALWLWQAEEGMWINSSEIMGAREIGGWGLWVVEISALGCVHGWG